MPTFSDLKEHFSKHKGKYISGAVLGTIGLGTGYYNNKLRKERREIQRNIEMLNDKYMDLMGEYP